MYFFREHLDLQSANLCAFRFLLVNYIIFTESQGASQLPIQVSRSHSEQADANSGESGDKDGATKAGDSQLKRKAIADANDVRVLFSTSRTLRPLSLKYQSTFNEICFS